MVNRVRYDMIARGDMLSAKEIGNLLHLGVVGVIPEDDHVTVYQQLGRVPDFAVSEKCAEYLADNVEKGTKQLVEPYMKRRWRLR